MAEAVLTSVEDLSVEWLSGALADAGALERGRVASFEARLLGGNWSSIARVELAFGPDARGELPSSLVLKICAGERAVFGPSEVHFYTRDYLDCDDAPIPRCYQAAYREEPRGYHLLLADLTSSHRDGFQGEPTLESACAVADALARLHAHHWGRERLARSGHSVAAGPELDRYFGHVGRGLEPLLATAGLEPRVRDALLRIFAKHRTSMERRRTGADAFTLLHGDVNPGNVLLPVSGQGSALLIDRQPFDWSLQCWLAASDLASFLVLHSDPEHRRRCEDAVLRAYRSRLAALGIELAWDELVFDYRLSVLQCVELAVEWLVVPEDREAKRWLWEMLLGRAMSAFFDLDCAALLAG